MQINAAGLFWDVGGTLVDYAMPLADFVRDCLASAGIDPEPISDAHIHESFERFYAGERSWKTVDES